MVDDKYLNKEEPLELNPMSHEVLWQQSLVHLHSLYHRPREEQLQSYHQWCKDHYDFYKDLMRDENEEN